MQDDLIDGLRRALTSDPDNAALQLHLAQLLKGAGRGEEALQALRAASERPACEGLVARALVEQLVTCGHLAEASLRLEAMLASGEDADLRELFDRVQSERGAPAVPPPAQRGQESATTRKAIEGSAEDGDKEPALAGILPDVDEEWAAQFDWGDDHVRLSDVAGLEEVKEQIQLRVLAPFKQPEIYEAFGRDAGGGLLLYGPPGCGKTFIARATAGEMGARFVSVAVHDVLDKYYGESEKAVHEIFEQARRSKPTVLFFDEFDALGAVRSRDMSQYFRSLVDAFLGEMDGVSGGNAGVLTFAATNAPWNLDPAFRRPGRFDRVLFVPPPELEGRKQLIERHASRLPGGASVPVDQLAMKTPLFSGADLKALCERAGEQALKRSLQSGKVSQVVADDFLSALKAMRNSTEEWLAGAKNHARYSNEGGRYDELASYLRAQKLW